MLGYTELFFREKLRIPVDYFQPFRRLTLPASVEAQAAVTHFSSWGAAVGAGLQALGDAPVRVNVLGAIGRAQAQKTRDFPALVVGATAGAALLLLPGIHGFWQSARLGENLAGQTAKVEEAGSALQKLEAENKKLLGVIQQTEFTLQLERERQRWPRLLEELRRHSPKKLWITSLQVLSVGETSGAAAPPGKPAEPVVPEVEIGGMFETQSEKADAEAVANFQKALEAGGVLRNVTMVERETPKYIDGKTDQVALKFRLKADWPPEGQPPSPKPAGKP